MQRYMIRSAALGLGLTLLLTPLDAATCSVPGSHATVNDAVSDLVCDTVTLAAQTHTESVVVTRPIALEGAPGGGSVLQGLLDVLGQGTIVTVRDLEIRNGCATATRSTAGAELVATGLSVARDERLPCPAPPLLSDGFESGSTSAWSSTSGGT